MSTKLLKLAAAAAAADDGTINDEEMAFRKAGETAARRCEAARWLRAMEQGAMAALPEDPPEEHFCAALRNGLILCNVLNRVNPGAVPKVVENPVITVQSSDGAAQSAIQYFENMRNFLVAVSEMNLLNFEASDIEKGGSSMKVVDCILCLKGYHEWKLAGGVGIWRYGGIVKIASSSKRLPAHLLKGGGSTELNQQMLEFLHLLTEVSLEEYRVGEALSSLFQHFMLRVVRAFLMEWSEAEDLSLDDMVIETVLEQAYKEFSMLLASCPNQVRSHLKGMLKDENRTRTKAELIEAISRSLKENSESLSLQLPYGSQKHLGSGKNSGQHQKELEKLKLSFNEMRLQVESSRTKWEEDLRRLESYFETQNHNISSYYKLLEENRMLYNQVQDLKGSIRVYCRVKPFLKKQYDERSTVDHIGENGEIMIANPQKQGKDGRKIFSFNKVFGPNASQSEVFTDTQSLIRSVMDGYNVCIFAYGQTGSGKTYTMSGPDITAEETWGVNYRSLNDLFDISQTRAHTMTYEVNVQMIEIYNEQVRDLLMVDGSHRRLEIRNSSQINGLNIPDANLVPVKCAQDVLELMKVGQRNRAVGATALNERSSRSHSVLTVHVQGKEIVSGSTLRGCLHLVDLAGSERVDKSEATGERLTEAKHINKSLSALGDVIAALAQKTSHVPYRNSKLTQVLQEALGGQAKTLMFVHVNPEADAFGETISTLKFAERVASIELGAAHVNKEAGQVKDLKEEIARLKSALDDKEQEVAQIKDLANRVTSEMRNARTRSPLTRSIGLKTEASQEVPRAETCTTETRSSSSGKQRRFRSPSLLQRELHEKSPTVTREGYMSAWKLKTPSPPIRSSFSFERSHIVKSSQKTGRMDDVPVPEVELQLQVSTSSPRNTYSAILTNRSLRKFWDLEENGRSKFTGYQEKQLKPVSVEKNRSDTVTKARKEEKMSRNSRETENEFVNMDSNMHVNRKAKKLHSQMTRTSQNMGLRASVRDNEPLSEGKHQWNKPPIAERTKIPLPETQNMDLRASVRDTEPLSERKHRGNKPPPITERTKIPLPETRRSRSLPRGKMDVA